jgi:putative endonuclease
MWYVYLLLCGDESTYTGITQDVERRLSEHKTNQGSKHTREQGVEKSLHTEVF